MSEYIEREALLEKVSRMIDYCQKNNWTKELAVLFQVGDAVMFHPAADVVEVKHGVWVEGRTLEKCSVCGKKGFPDWHYCPNCGAKMDGECREG